MMEQSEISKLHERIDDLVEKQNDTNIIVARIDTKMSMMPSIPSRPCSYFTEHIQQHKENTSLWRTPLISTLIDLGKMAVVAVVTWLAVRKN